MKIDWDMIRRDLPYFRWLAWDTFKMVLPCVALTLLAVFVLFVVIGV